MTPYWIATFIVWVMVMAYATSGAWAAARGSQRRGDPMRLAVWLVGLVMAGGTLRWYLRPDNAVLWKLIYAIAIMTGIYVLRLMSAYGRGDLIGEIGDE